MRVTKGHTRNRRSHHAIDAFCMFKLWSISLTTPSVSRMWFLQRETNPF